MVDLSGHLKVTSFEPSFLFAMGTVMSYPSLHDMQTQGNEDVSRSIVK